MTFPEELRRTDFLQQDRRPKSLVYREHEDLTPDGVKTARKTVTAMNQIPELGFTLKVKIRRSEYADSGYKLVTITPSQPVHPDFFASEGVFWSALRSIDTGLKMGGVSQEDAKTIIKAQMRGINTMQIIIDTYERKGNQGWPLAVQQISQALESSTSS